jgi:Protein of unknown function (DUF3263)
VSASALLNAVGTRIDARMELSARQRAILDFERSWWQLPGPKESAIRDHLSMSGTRYYRLLGELVDESAALEYDPLTVRRLRRYRDRRRRARYEGRRADPRST